MIPNCPYLKCPTASSSSPSSGSIVRNGFFYRSSDSRQIQRFRCKVCDREFSRATSNPCYRQKKRRINYSLNELLASGITQRRAARVLLVNRKTIARRFHFLAERATHRQARWLDRLPKQSIRAIQFDDLETAEHTKCKPLSVTLAVEPNTRKILNFKVSRMPAKGLLAKRARKKYGYRPDERKKGWSEALQELTGVLSPDVEIKSDENPHYPGMIKKHFPGANHIQIKGGRGAVTGQGELKKLKYDPIFSLNHTCAMLRANINRLFRRTWCISKTVKGLQDHLAIYVDYHNRVLTQNLPASAGKGAS